MSRPELTGHASLFYNVKEAKKYDSSSRMVGVQKEITERAVELLRLDQDRPSFILDIGCGSGLSGKVLENKGHVWIGCDVSRDMLDIANERAKRKRQIQNNRNNEEHMNDSDDEDDDEVLSPSSGDLMHHDMGTGLPFRENMFDACISISALQWLCYSNSKAQNPRRRLTRFFSSLYRVLKKGGRAVLQFYPETAEQAILISETATKVGFAGGVVVDYPNSAKAKKHYLVLSFDRSQRQRKESAALMMKQNGGTYQEVQKHVQVCANSVAPSVAEINRKYKSKVIRKNKGVKTKEWIVHKKATQRKRGKDVRPDTKYTARRRPHKF